jgi:hypothetical protein
MMGFTATQVDQMSLWQFLSQIEGYAEANTPDDKKTPRLSDAQAEDLSAWMDKKDQ